MLNTALYVYTEWAKSRYTVINDLLYTYFWPTLYNSTYRLPVMFGVIKSRTLSLLACSMQGAEMKYFKEAR